MEKEQVKYEIGYLMVPMVPEDKIDEEVAAARKLIEAQHGLIMSEGRPKMQKIAYPIGVKHVSPTGGFTSAYFGWFKFIADPGSLSDIEAAFKKDGKKFIRFLIIKSEKEEMARKAYNPAMRKKKETSPAAAGKSEEKLTIKPEEIDKKLEEMLEKSEVK